MRSCTQPSSLRTWRKASLSRWHSRVEEPSHRSKATPICWQRDAVGPITDASAFLSTIRQCRAHEHAGLGFAGYLAHRSRAAGLQPGKVSLAEVVEEVSHTLSKQIEEKEQTLEVSLPDDLPAAGATRLA
jgi:signal transduction histidine kinase